VRSEFDKSHGAPGKRFLLTENEHPAGHKPVVDRGSELALQILLEIGEGEIAAQNEMKRSLGKLPAYVLLLKLNAGLKRLA